MINISEVDAGDHLIAIVPGDVGGRRMIVEDCGGELWVVPVEHDIEAMPLYMWMNSTPWGVRRLEPEN